jgi:hypothetical protein
MCQLLLAHGANKTLRDEDGDSVEDCQFWKANKTRIETDAWQQNDLWAIEDMTHQKDLIFAISILNQNVLIGKEKMLTNM